MKCGILLFMILNKVLFTAFSVDFYNKRGNQSINQSKRIYIAPYVAGESEARVGLG